MSSSSEVDVGKSASAPRRAVFSALLRLWSRMRRRAPAILILDMFPDDPVAKVMLAACAGEVQIINA